MPNVDESWTVKFGWGNPIKSQSSALAYCTEQLSLASQAFSSFALSLII
jgi:hypothetical protein